MPRPGCGTTGLAATVDDAWVWGLVAGSSFVIGGLVALYRQPTGRVLGVVMGFGSGALISAVSYELVDEAGQIAGGSGRVAGGLVLGAVLAVGLVGGFSREEGPPAGAHTGAGSEWPVVLALTVSAAAEAVVIVGSLIGGHGVSVAVVTAVFLCGVPEAIAATPGLRMAVGDGWRIAVAWAGLAGWCGLVAAVASAVLSDASANTVALTLACAGGVVLTTLTTHLVPRAYALAGSLVGVPVVVGFALSFGLIELV